MDSWEFSLDKETIADLFFHSVNNNIEEWEHEEYGLTLARCVENDVVLFIKRMGVEVNNSLVEFLVNDYLYRM